MTNELLSKRVADLTMADLIQIEHALNSSPALPPGITFGVAFGHVEQIPEYPMAPIPAVGRFSFSEEPALSDADKELLAMYMKPAAAAIAEKIGADLMELHKGFTEGESK